MMTILPLFAAFSAKLTTYNFEKIIQINCFLVVLINIYKIERVKIIGILGMKFLN